MMGLKKVKKVLEVSGERVKFGVLFGAVEQFGRRIERDDNE
jgi:hypothetical protein